MQYLDIIKLIENALSKVDHKSCKNSNRVTFKPRVRKGDGRYDISLQQIGEVAFLALGEHCTGVRKIQFIDGTTVEHCPEGMVPVLMISRSPVEHTNTRQSQWI